MNLKSIPDPIWHQLAREALRVFEPEGTDEEKSRVFDAVSDLFYKHIYKMWSLDKLEYAPNLPTGMDKGWSDLVREWSAIEEFPELAHAMPKKSFSVGKAVTQIDEMEDRDEALSKARLGELYNDSPLVSRFQFVLSRGGGIVLFNRMRRACQRYIKEKLNGNKSASVIKWWKVFGEAAGVGRSDSCVVYLTEASNDPAVIEVIKNYIWPEIDDLVNMDFTPLGFHRIDGKPLWVMDMPDGEREELVLGMRSGASAGGLLSLVFGMAFYLAILETGPDESALVAKAKMEAEEIKHDLYA